MNKTENEYAINLQTGRLIKKTTSLYKKLKKLKQVKEIEPEEPKVKEKPKEPEPKPEPQPEPIKPQPEEEPFDERRLQEKLADISTSVVKKNMKQIIKNQKLSDEEYDLLLKKMLYKKLCLSEPKLKEEKKEEKKTKSKTKKKKFKIVEPSSSSESESD